MFLGTIPDKVRKILKHYIPHLGPKVSVLCSGNFTFESLLRHNGYKGEIVSNDVSIYTCSVGWALTDVDFRLEIKEPSMEWILPYLEDPISRAAAVLIFFDMSSHYKQKNDYQVRMWNSYRRQFDVLHKKMVDKLTAFKQQVRIDRFCAEDMKLRLAVDSDVTLAAFMPTYKGGYESLYRVMDTVFDWDKPDYEIFEQTEEFYQHWLDTVQSRWLIMSEHALHDINPNIGLPDTIVEKNRSITCRIYGNIRVNHYYIPRPTHIKPFLYPAISDNDIRKDSKVELAICKDSRQMQYLRQVYVGAAIKLSQEPPACFYVLVDGHLAGAIGLDLGKYGGPDASLIYMLFDFALPSKYARLSKLIVMAALTHEVKTLLEKKFVNRFTQLLTTAFTNKPVSMKYRGVMNLEKRRDGYLKYGGPMGQYSLQEAFEQWWKKHGKKTK